ncbi:hypothetical protein [Chondromyces crocatus]|uniref:Uncharacterized protein n=1 Tax=Chondromyces crocatus TaxID=52 RepID=A0A0K1EAG9_CHOCO|nr:hypothetical protein [Chondromyces crocatus]AKT37854.1 uncharacterized protein CMC5_019970 [Chondromyces crocatus]
MIHGALWAFGGLVVTVVSVLSAEGGGRYIHGLRGDDPWGGDAPARPRRVVEAAALTPWGGG